MSTNDALERKNFVVEATATDTDGNTASCKFMITAMRKCC